jgi:hypothetical protein
MAVVAAVEPPGCGLSGVEVASRLGSEAVVA